MTTTSSRIATIADFSNPAFPYSTKDPREEEFNAKVKMHGRMGAENVAGSIWAGTPVVGTGMFIYHAVQTLRAGKRLIDAIRSGSDSDTVRRNLLQTLDHAAATAASALPGGQAYFWARSAVQGGMLAMATVKGFRQFGQALNALS
ncbi:MAG: hypothetical protein AAF654_12005 [Myxococcota bacterium]